MITFFRQPEQSTYYVVETTEALSPLFFDRLTWLFGGAKPLAETTLSGSFIGTRRELVTPWSTNAVEIVRNMGIDSVVRIEEFEAVSSSIAMKGLISRSSLRTSLPSLSSPSRISVLTIRSRV